MSAGRVLPPGRTVVVLAAAISLLVPALASADWQASGRFFYRDREQDLGGFTGTTVDLPARHVDFVIEDANTSLVLAGGSTDDTGSYSILVPDGQTRDVRVRFITASSYATDPYFIVTVRNSAAGYQEYSVVSAPVTGHAPSTDVNFGDLTALPGMGGEAFNIYDVILNGQLLVKLLDGGGSPADPLTVYWHSLSTDGTYYSHASRTMHLTGDEGYDDTVIAHEHAHYVNFSYSHDDSPGGPHYLDDNNQDIRLAWSEGYATYFASAGRLSGGVASPDPTYYIDTDGSGNLDFSYEIEGPSITATGGASEMAVQAVLWDIIDDTSTPDPSPGADDDPLVDRSAANVWEVTANYLPLPSVAYVSLEDFWDGWHRPGPGHDREAEIMAVFGALTVEYFEDALEDDDLLADARWISSDGLPQHHTFYPAGDADWSWFPAESGKSYTIETTDLFSDGNTEIAVADSLFTVLASNDDRGSGDQSSKTTLLAPYTGRVFVRVVHQSDFGVYGSYNLRVFEGMSSSVPLTNIGGVTAGTANSRGAAWADIDNDNLYDLYVCNVSSPNYLYRNLGGGAFASEAAARGVGLNAVSEGACFGDYDNDGDPDLYVTTVGNNDVLYANQFIETGTPDFINVTAAAEITDVASGRTANWVDVNRDGFLDLFVANVEGGSCKLWINDQDGTFTDATSTYGLAVNGVITSCWADLDSDGDDDVFLGVNAAPSMLFENQGGVFADVTGTAGTVAGLKTFAADWGDYDGDGLLDLTVADAGGANSLYRNLGGWVFEDVSVSANAASPFLGVGSLFADHDLDADLDIYTANFLAPNALYDNLSGTAFSVTGAEPFIGPSRSMAWADYDNDGDPDFYVASQAVNALLQNGAPPAPWIQVSLRGRTTNRDGIGARIYATAGGKRQMRHVSAGHGFGAQSSRRVSFGFGDGVAVVDTVVIDWPSGKRTIDTQIAVNEFHLFDEADAIDVPEGPPLVASLRLAAPWPNPASSRLTFSLEVPAHLTGERVTLDIYTVNGRRVTRVADRAMSPGPQRLVWNLTDGGGSRLPAGMYLAQLRAGSESRVRKFVVLSGAVAD
jgi:hypothetical protein